MHLINQIKKKLVWFVLLTTVLLACNKAPLDPQPITQPTQGTSPTLATLLSSQDSNLTFLTAAVVRAGLLPRLSSPNLRFTVFAPDNNAFIASGIPSIAVINSLSPGFLDTVLKYHIIPQAITDASITMSFPNLQYPTIFNPNTAASPLLRLSVFLSKRATNVWVNNIPVTLLNGIAVNGVLHRVSRLVIPPSAFLWNRIAADPNLLLFKTAIQRADQDTTAPGFLQSVLGTNPSIAIGANFTVFAPDTTAFKNMLSALSGGAIPANAPNGNFIAFINTLPITSVKAIVVYHALAVRSFAVNFPATTTFVPTLLNSVVKAHPGVAVQATIVPVPGFGLAAVAATVQGVANASAANIYAQDNHYINGVLHVVDQVLLPQ